jgi:two-component system sensor histidine kinase BarA
MRLKRISLATKYRVLFGAAVLLIIGAALAVPWSYVEVIVLQQPFRDAQRIAETHFRYIMARGESAASAHDENLLLPEQPQHDAQFVRMDLNPRDPDSIVNQSLSDPFVDEAFDFLRKHPNKRFFYRTATDGESRQFEYAHAVWVTRRCLSCHSEGRTARPYHENQLAGIITVRLPTENSGHSSLVNRVVIASAGALAGILAILVFYLITTRFILAPIHELRSVALRVTDGDLSVRAAVQTGDEFQQLSENINTMLERLRISQEELKKANRLLDEKLGEMAETNVALYEANRVKSEFLANVSHELRTPLTSIIGFAELLRERPQAENDARGLRYAENILISGRILLEIINDLLDLAKIEAGKVELEVESVRPDELCETLLDHIRPLADRRELQLERQVEGDLPAIFTDRKKLRQVLFNLLSNAVKFTPEGGRVTLSAARHDGLVQFAVCDTGPGIAPENHEPIFEKFRQIDQSHTREHHGTGLGLAIAKELTYLLGGEIGVDSALGEGATFWVRLPTAAPEPRQRPLIPLT